jgi:predicted N-acetyltransferase YhbS
MKVSIRSEKPSDYEDITLLNDIAFGQTEEGILVEKLRKNPKFVKELSRVAIFDNSIVGHILFFPVLIRDNEMTHPTLALAPMSVIPEFQEMGIGASLVKDGLAIAQKHGYQSVIVLGHPTYYPKFGFRPASEWGIKSPFEAPDEAFMAIALQPEALKNISGSVEYPIEFAEVGT